MAEVPGSLVDPLTPRLRACVPTIEQEVGKLKENACPPSLSDIEAEEKSDEPMKKKKMTIEWLMNAWTNKDNHD